MGNINKLKLAQRGAYLSIVTYIILSGLKLYFGVFYDSAAVRADALNNMTDIFASVAVLIGLKISIRPPDDNHPYGHLKSENIASLVVSFIIIFVGVQVLVENVPAIFSPSVTKPNPVVIYISVVGGLIMLAVYYINSQLAAKTNSSSLKSAAMDNLSDSLISLGTAAGLVLTQHGLPIADVIIASVLGLLIIYTGFKILKSAVFALSDGYNDADLIEHKEDVLEVDGVLDVKSIKGRYHGSSIFLDVTIIVDPEISVTEAHRICDRVEEHMHDKGIMSLYVHPEPLSEE
ncbi:cation diffusion facilitator family transporter [Jeotgalicoccus sp. FSL K6-3177]|uniref:cation diffusion facilitator family transporter n=1 Tax=Jeotgalicoccus sp. FSL K6-3177 TaxID=2921494 RepID=UPI0030FDDE6B